MFQRILFYFLLLVLGLAGELAAQDYEVFPREEYYGSPQQERSFSGGHWLEVTEGIDYSESVRAERTEDENFFTDGEEKKKKQRAYEGQRSNAAAFWNALLKFFIIALGIGIVAVIIARFLGPEGLGKPRSQKVKNTELEIHLQNIEEKIHESDLDQFIRQALEEHNFNLAIRLYYLAIIKELSLAKAIRWKRDKTNRDYILELSGRDYLPEFRALTNIFERVWYGNRHLNEVDYQQLKLKFESLISTLKQTANLPTTKPE